LGSVSQELCGFAFEGAAMALALLVTVTPWPTNRIADFLGGPGDAHSYMIHVGAGWMWARAPWLAGRTRRQLEPLLGWLAYDGWGFHEGFFHWPDYLSGRLPPARLKGYERRVFDQGFGRSLWFINGGNLHWLLKSVKDLNSARWPDLWSGIGLAATYAGQVSEADLAALRAAAGAHGPELAQGAAFAAKARQRAGNLTDYTDTATGVLCGCSAIEAGRLCDSTLEDLPATGPEPPYEIWRQRLQNHFRDAERATPMRAE
jgi:hypothetical protein